MRGISSQFSPCNREYGWKLQRSHSTLTLLAVHPIPASSTALHSHFLPRPLAGSVIAPFPTRLHGFAGSMASSESTPCVPAPLR